MSLASVERKYFEMHSIDGEGLECQVFLLYRFQLKIVDESGEARRLDLYNSDDLRLFIEGLRKKFDVMMRETDEKRKEEAEKIYAAMIAMLCLKR